MLRHEINHKSLCPPPTHTRVLFYILGSALSRSTKFKGTDANYPLLQWRNTMAFCAMRSFAFIISAFVLCVEANSGKLRKSWTEKSWESSLCSQMNYNKKVATFSPTVSTTVYFITGINHKWIWLLAQLISPLIHKILIQRDWKFMSIARTRKLYAYYKL